MARVPDGVLDRETANDPAVVSRKSGLTPWHCRVLVALERIADYYEQLPPLKSRKGGTDA